jgi:putative flavoprotein involved in K+ transport
MEHLDVVIVGGGQAGLSLSWWLRLSGIDHVVLERGRVGESWRSGRWDSFTLVTPAWMTRLPGLTQRAGTAASFTDRASLLEILERYRTGLPVRCGVGVVSLRQDGSRYRLLTTAGELTARSVIVASGAQRVATIPALAQAMPGDIAHLHAGTYRSPDEIRPGAVLVIGSGQSGGQIAEELARTGRRVFLCTSRVGRVPRRYRGRDVHDWTQEMGLADQTPDQLADRAQMRAPHPLLSGARGGHTVALQQLGRDGVVLLGRAVRMESTTLHLGDDLLANIWHGDERAASFRSAVDTYVERSGLVAPAAEPDPAERPLGSFDDPRQLDLVGHEVHTVIWCTGFGPDTGWIDLPILDGRGHVVSRGGVTTAPGVYTLGAPWLTHQTSGLLAGVGKDASRIALDVEAFLGATPPADLHGRPTSPARATRTTARPASVAPGLPTQRVSFGRSGSLSLAPLLRARFEARAARTSAAEPAIRPTAA